jgi:hypothetical protein
VRFIDMGKLLLFVNASTGNHLGEQYGYDAGQKYTIERAGTADGSYRCTELGELMEVTDDLHLYQHEQGEEEEQEP